MNPNVVKIGVPALAVGIMAAAWFMLPSLQSPTRMVEEAASLQLEAARRLLHSYDAGLASSALLIDRLKEEGIEVDAYDLPEEVADEYQQLHAKMWEAYTPMDWSRDVPTPLRANYGDVARQIGEGLAGYARLADQNEALLQQALSTVDQALAVAVGNESSQSHAEAHRLRALILYHKGMAEWVRARLLRRESDAYRRDLAALAATAGAMVTRKTLVAQSRVEPTIADLQAEITQADRTLRADRDALQALEQKVEGVEARLAEARSRADQAQQAMDRLKAAGIDFAKPNAVQDFRTKLEQHDRAYRQAAREAHTLQFGTFPKAELDRSGDYLHGRYVENGSKVDLTVEFGLRHYRDELAAATVTIQYREEEVKALRASLGQLQEMRTLYEVSQQQAGDRMAEIAIEADEFYDNLNRVEAEAFATEEGALRLYDQAAGAAGRAAQLSGQWVADARDRTQNLSPEAKKRSAYDMRTRDGWMGGFAFAEEADARLAGAWVHHARYEAAEQNAALFVRIAPLVSLQEIDVEAEQTKASDAHDAGVRLIEQAMAALKKAHRDTGKSWTVSAQGAGTIYLMALFGYGDYVRDTIDAYRAALKGRETEPFATELVARLNRLENR